MIQAWWAVLISFSTGQVVGEMPMSTAPIPGNANNPNAWQVETGPPIPWITRVDVECSKIVGIVASQHNLKNQDRVWARCELRVT